MESPKFYIAVYIYVGPYVKKWKKRAQTEKIYGDFWEAELGVITGQVREPQDFLHLFYKPSVVFYVLKYFQINLKY